jgi:HD-GYP domain-containing protein (c-di-GMP phosphodiesterase class II)
MESQGDTTKRVPVSEVRTGMYIVSLDRSWIDTPFLFNRKLIKSSEEIELLKKHGIREVVIDTRRGADTDTAVELPETSAPQPGPSEHADRPVVEIRHATADSVEFKFMVQEFDVARRIHDEALAATQSIFDGAGRGSPVNVAVAAKVVSDLSGTVLRSPEASLLLTQMRRFQGDLFAHSVNVCVLSLVVGAAEGFEGDNAILGLGALLHDLGETRLPRNLIRKQDSYTESERQLVEQHPTLGFNAIQHIENIPERARRIVIEHHERADGSGYPAKLKGEQISLFSRIVAITDAYDTMLMGRNRLFLQPIEVLRQIYLEAENGAFDRALIEKFIRALGVYPIGSLVELNTGERGIVIAANRTDRLKPTLRIVAWPNGQEDPIGPVVSLAEFSAGSLDRRIVRVLDPGKERINIMAHLQIAAGDLVV